MLLVGLQMQIQYYKIIGFINNSINIKKNPKMKNLLILLLFVTAITCLPDTDSLSPPGMINETVYSGYLDTDISTRKIHYVFVAARQQPEKAPLTIWFNGGPGCSSLIGMLQQIGPYLVGNKYAQGDLLTRNPYSWNQISNLLFLESPAIVGFSTDKDPLYQWDDRQAADDAFAAIKYFFNVKATEFKMRDVYLSGQSYAGKYVPDVTVRILRNNQGPMSQYINIKGILLGNGVMNFAGNSLDKSEIQYMYEHDFIDDRLWNIYNQACSRDFYSPRCQYFQYELELDEDQVNPYNVFEVCKQAKSAQTARMMQAIRKFNKKSSIKNKTNLLETSGDINLGQITQCPNDNGAISYWNLNKYHYHVDKVGKEWSPCVMLTYTISDDGSMKQYMEIFLNKAVKVWLFNGDWDDVVPYRDTEKNLELLKIKKTGEWDPWFLGEHHAGFYQVYEKLTLITVKGGSHMVPQAKPKEAYQMFYNFINNRPINTPV